MPRHLVRHHPSLALPRIGRAMFLVPLMLLLMTTLFASDPPSAQAYSPTSKDYIEIVIANGRFYAYDQGNVNGVIPPGWSGDLTDVTAAPRYNLNGGPCTYALAGQPCAFENYSIYQYHGHRWEAIEAYGRYWNFDLDDSFAPIPGNGGYLSALSYYNRFYTNYPIRDGTATFTGPGPCYGTSGANCKLDSRGIYWRNNRQYEATTSSQQSEDYYYVWDVTASGAITLYDAGRLKDAPRLVSAGGPCDPARIGAGRCRFDTRDFYYDPTSHHVIESIHAKGQFWNFDMDAYFDYGGGRKDWAAMYGNGWWLSDIKRYNQPGRPCYQRPHEQCTMDARLFQYNLGADMLWELEGFGENTIGGLGGRVVQVTEITDSPVGQPGGTGTLRWALEQGAGTGNPDTPLIIAFALRDPGPITLNHPICVASNKTLDGRGSDVTITNWGLHIVDKSNVIINNVTITNATGGVIDCRGEEDALKPYAMGEDAVRIWGSRNIWLHHVTLNHATDGLVDIVSDPHHVASREITVSWSRFENHSKVLLIGDSPTEPADRNATVTVHHNFFNATGQRHPRLRFGKADVYNNYLFQWQTNAMLATCSGQLRAEANIFEMGPNSPSTAIGLHNDTDAERGCSDGYAASVENWARNAGYGAANLTPQPPHSGTVFTRPYTAHSLQPQVRGDEMFRSRLVMWAGQR